jgi:hypothetical protein
MGRSWLRSLGSTYFSSAGRAIPLVTQVKLNKEDELESRQCPIFVLGQLVTDVRQF